MKKITDETKTTRPVYQRPQIVTFTDDQLLEELGPARAYGSNGCDETFTSVCR